MQLIEKAKRGDSRAIARLISQVENETPEATQIMQELFQNTGHAHLIGITGPPGSGKSTLTDKLVKELRKRAKRVAILAVDPTSPFTGGAILGDRVRMADLNLDQGVYIRSMGTRGRLGGLAKTTSYVVKILDACGFDYIFIETVGVGQSEIDIVKTADTTIVVSVPGLGDDIQAIKAGILEIGDIFLVNKADKDGANRVALELEMMLDLKSAHADWKPPILMTVGSQNKGTNEVVDSLIQHFQYLSQSGLLTQVRRKRLVTEVMELLNQRISAYLMEKLARDKGFELQLDRMMRKETDPYTLVSQIFTDSVKLN